jgi:hypothetical protein
MRRFNRLVPHENKTRVLRKSPRQRVVFHLHGRVHATGDIFQRPGEKFFGLTPYHRAQFNPPAAKAASNFPNCAVKANANNLEP